MTTSLPVFYDWLSGDRIPRRRQQSFRCMYKADMIRTNRNVSNIHAVASNPMKEHHNVSKIDKPRIDHCCWHNGGHINLNESKLGRNGICWVKRQQNARGWCHRSLLLCNLCCDFEVGMLVHLHVHCLRWMHEELNRRSSFHGNIPEAQWRGRMQWEVP